MESNIFNEIIQLIKKKKELMGLADSIIKDALYSYLSKNKISLKKVSSRDIKLIVKEIRKKLRLMTGQFQVSDKKENLLLSHSSTKERMENYHVIEEVISSLNIKSILDLGCGLNPLSIANKNIRYYAVDIRQDEVDIINNHFKSKGIQGEAFIYDLRKLENKLPEADICLILKVFDVLEKKGHKLAERIINFIDCKYFLISFSTKTLSGKSMNHPQRGWIERLLTRLNYSFKIIETNNEVFYLANKLNN